MKTRLIFLFLFPAIALAQLPTRQQIREARTTTRELIRDGFDVVLDPIEQIGIAPRSIEEYNAGNWGNVALETDKYFDEIVRRASRRVHVYVFDTGGKFDHPALNDTEKTGKTFTGEPDPVDGSGHGTHCAGIIAGVADFPLGAARALIEKDLIYIYPVKVLTNAGSGLFTWIAAGIQWANIEAKRHIAAGDFVIYSMSLGAGSGAQNVTDALNAAAEAGVLIVAASGNTGGRGVNFPANVPTVQAIAALQNTSPISRATFSTFGPEVFQGLPGQGILSAYKGGGYATLSGTSMATPHAAAMAAIAASIYPNLNAGGVLRCLELSAVDIAPSGRDEHTGHGVPMTGKILAYDPGSNPVDPPKPEPPKPVEPVKPERAHVFAFTDAFQVVYGRQGSPEWKDLAFRVELTLTHKKDADSARKSLTDAVRDHWTRRGYYLFPDSDDADALYWVAYFAEMLLKKDYGLDVKVSRIWDVRDPALRLENPVQGKAKAARVNRASIVTFERIL